MKHINMKGVKYITCLGEDCSSNELLNFDYGLQNYKNFTAGCYVKKVYELIDRIFSGDTIRPNGNKNAYGYKDYDLLVPAHREIDISLVDKSMEKLRSLGKETIFLINLSCEDERLYDVLTKYKLKAIIFTSSQVNENVSFISEDIVKVNFPMSHSNHLSVMVAEVILRNILSAEDKGEAELVRRASHAVCLRYDDDKNSSDTVVSLRKVMNGEI